MRATKQDAWMSPEEYLATEPFRDIKHEYVDGKHYAMVGATVRPVRPCAHLDEAL